MDENDLWPRLGLSLVIGMLVGLQRERQKEVLAGIRTFSLVALLGTVCGVLAKEYGGFVLVAGFLSVAVTAAVGNYIDKEKPNQGDGGITTEIALLLVFALGAWLSRGELTPPLVVGATAFVLLYAKQKLHGWTASLQDPDWNVIARFVLVSCVILPILPNHTYGPFDVLNPRETWLMVVVIVGLGLAGFIAQKLFGERTGLIAAGLLGGLISSTATTVSYSRDAKQSKEVSAASVIVLIASTVVYVRLIVEATIAAPQFNALRLPLSIMGATSLVFAAVAYWLGHRGTHERHTSTNPSQFRAAFIFAGLYALISFATAAATHYFGDAGMYTVAALSGLTDLDAITLSASRMVAAGKMAESDAWRVIVVAVASNLLFKSGLLLALGTRKLFLRAGLMLITTAAVGIALIFLLD